MKFRGGWCGARGLSVLKVSEVESVAKEEERRNEESRGLWWGRERRGEGRCDAGRPVIAP